MLKAIMVATGVVAAFVLASYFFTTDGDGTTQFFKRIYLVIELGLFAVLGLLIWFAMVSKGASKNDLVSNRIIEPVRKFYAELKGDERA